MKYLYPIEVIKGKKRTYYFGETNQKETKKKRIGTCSNENCSHDTPIEASDCYRQYMLDNEWNQKGKKIQPRKCCKSGCANQTERAAILGNYLEFPLCDEHRNKATVKQICGWGFVLNMRKLEEGD
jgi:hypothetical protein